MCTIGCAVAVAVCVCPHELSLTAFNDCRDSEYLESQHLFLAVKDSSQKKRELEELGYAVISLRGACGESPRAFEAKLFIKGLQRGVLRGNIHVLWPDSQAEAGSKGYAHVP